MRSAQPTAQLQHHNQTIGFRPTSTTFWQVATAAVDNSRCRHRLHVCIYRQGKKCQLLETPQFISGHPIKQVADLSLLYQ